MVLTIATFLLALIPFGTPVSYLGVGLWLFSQGQTMEAIGVILWGVLIVSSSDNVIRPLVISGATQIPFFDYVRCIGWYCKFWFSWSIYLPVILAVLLAIWREWLHETIDPEPMPKTTMIYDSDDDLPPSKN